MNIGWQGTVAFIGRGSVFKGVIISEANGVYMNPDFCLILRNFVSSSDGVGWACMYSAFF
jgi:hypothetical protein